MVTPLTLTVCGHCARPPAHLTPATLRQALLQGPFVPVWGSEHGGCGRVPRANQKDWDLGQVCLAPELLSLCSDRRTDPKPTQHCAPDAWLAATLPGSCSRGLTLLPTERGSELGGAHGDTNSRQ